MMLIVHGQEWTVRNHIVIVHNSEVFLRDLKAGLSSANSYPYQAIEQIGKRLIASTRLAESVVDNSATCYFQM